MLFIHFGISGVHKKTQRILWIFSILFLITGCFTLQNQDLANSIFFFFMFLLMVFYNLVMVKPWREKNLRKSIERYYLDLTSEEIYLTVGPDLITERTSNTYQEFKNPAIQTVYELKHQFVFLTRQGQILIVLSESIEQLDTFQAQIKEWYSYENHHQWKW